MSWEDEEWHLSLEKCSQPQVYPDNSRNSKIEEALPASPQCTTTHKSAVAHVPDVESWEELASMCAAPPGLTPQYVEHTNDAAVPLMFPVEWRRTPSSSSNLDMPSDRLSLEAQFEPVSLFSTALTVSGSNYDCRVSDGTVVEQHLDVVSEPDAVEDLLDVVSVPDTMDSWESSAARRAEELELDDEQGQSGLHSTSPEFREESVPASDQHVNQRSSVEVDQMEFVTGLGARVNERAASAANCGMRRANDRRQTGMCFGGAAATSEPLLAMWAPNFRPMDSGAARPLSHGMEDHYVVSPVIVDMIDETWQRGTSLEVTTQRSLETPSWRRGPRVRRASIDKINHLLLDGPPVHNVPIQVDTRDEMYLAQDAACQTEELITASNGGDSCVVCLMSKRSHAFSPCGHCCVCEACALTLRKKKNARCLICREPAPTIFKLHFMHGSHGSSTRLPEWRQAALAAKGGRAKSMRLQSSALAGLQHILFENTTKERPRRRCKTLDVSCQIDDARDKCCSCHALPPTCAAFPCGHVCLCAGCASRPASSNFTWCPVCKASVDGFARIYGL